MIRASGVDLRERGASTPRPLLQVIIGSTRQGRVGPAVATWFARLAAADARFDVEVLDLAEIALPMFDEPHHPAARRYTHPHTKRWSEQISRGDIYALVIPEYNHSFNAAIKNALDHLHDEWSDKGFGFVTYGGVAGGARAALALRPVVLAVKGVPVHESVTIPRVATLIGSDGALQATEPLRVAALALLDELFRRETALRQLRTGPSVTC